MSITGPRLLQKSRNATEVPLSNSDIEKNEESQRIELNNLVEPVSIQE